MIKHLTAVLFAAASVIAVPPVAIADARVAVSCDGVVPEEWRRPGGYCDQANGTGTLAPTGTGTTPTCIIIASLEGLEEAGDRLLVADLPPCCILVNYDGLDLDEGERLTVAVIACAAARGDEFDTGIAGIILAAG